ncbi:transcription antitermination factor NusB [Loigolactobacillus iwatensis]|uniref:transcription antitermination factor NusB n=1 Tax=Loigolactobacillus iwatensis TaxID=1267156 RepID=UPI000F7F91CD|nr:transcription antitermination factor NusB [Loigolactobacillus iwatensis]
MTITRHKIRELAFQTLFAIDANPEVDQTALMNSLLVPVDSAAEESAIPAYLQSLVAGVSNSTEVLDEQIAAHLSENWSIKRIAKTDLVILRIAIFEITNVEDVPARVAVNEALELARKYNDERSRRFINGVLSAILREQATPNN